MSVIVAIKENGVVYMGADSQTTSRNRKINQLNETSYKVTRLENGILVGFCGRVAAKQEILSTKDVFVLDEDGKLTKQHIVNKIVPKLVAKMKLIGDEESGAIDVGILLAYENELFEIKSCLDVIRLNDSRSMGAGDIYTNYWLFERKDIPVKERLLKALIASSKYADSVSGPYVLIDTQTKEYEIIDMGRENY